jgi:hypothetical protein
MIVERLLYISSQIKVPKLPNTLRSYVPMIDMIEAIQSIGISGYCIQNEIPIEQVQSLIRKGRQYGDIVSIDEYKALISKSVWHGINDTTLSASEKIVLYGILDTWNKNRSISLVDKKATSFSKELEMSTDDEFLFSSGLEPLDKLSGIPSNSLTIILAKTGVGKTSFMLSLAHSLADKYRVVYVSYEMSDKAVRYRAKDLSNLDDKVILLTGNTTIEEIEEYCTEDTIIFVDYLALVPSVSNGELRHKLAHIASELLRLSNKTKAVITAHQANRTEKELNLDSISEAYAVSWYAALVLGLEKQGIDYDNIGYHTVTLSTLKHRYGRVGTKVVFPYNYSNLHAMDTSVYGDVGIDYEVNW